jgi:hypothetical protein
LVNGRGVEEFTARAVQILECDEHRRSLGAKARARALAEFDWSNRAVVVMEKVRRAAG